jgi:hypothetical protein
LEADESQICKKYARKNLKVMFCLRTDINFRSKQQPDFSWTTFFAAYK